MSSVAIAPAGAAVSHLAQPSGSHQHQPNDMANLNLPIDPSLLSTASTILGIIFRYRLNTQSPPSADGHPSFLTQIYAKVRACQPIAMCLPAFPFKSPNAAAKVLGALPDKADEFALARLDGMCAQVEDVYPPGAEVVIISDGLCYNDLLSVPDKHVWAYGQALRALASSLALTHLSFARLADLVDPLPHLPASGQLDEMTYVANANNFRLAVLNRFGRAGWDVDAQIRDDEDTRMTYCGYMRFLETDLETVYPVGGQDGEDTRSRSAFRKVVAYNAKQMLYRGDAFARAVRETFPLHIRLSIHPSTDASKISVSLLPTDAPISSTPWHCCLGVRLDGTTTTGPRSMFERPGSSWELVHDPATGRPSFFREASELYAGWPAVSCTPTYPAGLLIQPLPGTKGTLSITDIDFPRVRALAERNSPVVLRGFTHTTSRPEFVAAAHKLGAPQPWNAKFGLVLAVKDAGGDARGMNNVLSAEDMPFHYDGVFKLAPDASGNLVPHPPRLQFFVGVAAAKQGSGGCTLFAGSPLLFKHLPAGWSVDALRGMTWDTATRGFETNGKGAELCGLPLVVDHPATGAPCLRYHEPWPQSRTAFEATEVKIHGVHGREVGEVLDGLLRDRRVATWHVWQKGDLVVADNVLGLHTRSKFEDGEGEGRELWRIHVN